MFEEYFEGIGVGIECGGDVGSQVIVGGGIDDQDFFWFVDDGVFGFDVVDLLFDVGFVVCWMGSDVDEVMYVWFDDYENFGCQMLEKYIQELEMLCIVNEIFLFGWIEGRNCD